MNPLQDRYDDAMFEFSRGETAAAIEKLKEIVQEDPRYFDAQLALGGAYFAQGDFAAAVAEGHKAQALRPNDQLAHTNLSRAYMKLGDKKTAEHHALQSRIASWKENMTPPTAGAAPDELAMAPPPSAPPIKPPEKFPEMPWKKKTKVEPSTPGTTNP